MTAAGIAARVLGWAAEPAGAVPVGPLLEVSQLTSPPALVQQAATRLAWRTAARLGAGVPPFGAGTREQIGPGAILLAAAVGGRRQATAAATLARAVPPAIARQDPGGWYDLVARHGLAGPVVTALNATEGIPGADGGAEPIQEVLLEASPLTAVLYRPPLRALRADTTGQAVAVAVDLLARPHGQAVLAAGLASWSPFQHVLAWRGSLLSRLRHSHQDLLLDVYLAARTRFAAEWDQRISWAARQLAGGDVLDPLALATLRFWAPLAAIERGTPLSRLRPLLSGQERTLFLVRQFRLDQVGAA